MQRKGEIMKSRRRQFLAAGATLGVTALAGGLSASLGAEEKETGEAEEISPAEDLMREHGVLKRILLIYSEAVRRLRAREDLPLKPVAEAARIIRSFIEDYHGKLEEDYVFPRFKKAGKLVDLVDVLLQQHGAGRRLTDTTLRLSSAQAFNSPGDRRALAESMRLFVRMYNPHEAREDTVLFPAFRGIVSPNEYAALGEDFEQREHELFGKDGFQQIVGRVAGIEKALGIYDLSQFTARA
jgi:hemerythrin-like domain-containing protein